MNLQQAIEALRTAVDDLARAALSDDKTSLGNALALGEAASLVGTGGDNPDVVVFGDLNRFKGLNDRFGHEAGDAAIYAVGELIKRLIVDECHAQAFHQSGDEFVILLSNQFLEKFKAVAPHFASCTFQYEGETRKTAMSFGYSINQGEDNYSVLVNRAETACQVAKSLGDGEYVEWSEEIERQAIDILRDDCMNCGAKIECKVPRHAFSENKRLLACPCCGMSLGKDES